MNGQKIEFSETVPIVVDGEFLGSYEVKIEVTMDLSPEAEGLDEVIAAGMAEKFKKFVG